MGYITLFLIVLSTIMLAVKRASLAVWGTMAIAWLLFLTFADVISSAAAVIAWIVMTLACTVLLVKPIRRRLITKYVLAFYQRVMPKMSHTEKEALSAGSVSWEGDLFTGDPDWDKLFEIQPAKLTREEQDFLDGPVETLCQMLDVWDIMHNHADLPDKVWTYLKKQGFFGLIIPKQYGGKAFSAFAHSQIITKISSVSTTAASTVAVPNSLGPAELLLRYGTATQKNHYLPRLARGEEIPCFALTGPTAGSDAAGMPDKGVVCWGQFNGEKILGVKLNWDKRYITLAPVATLLGLAFKLYDPNNLIGSKANIGITCALIPVNTPGVRIGRRHCPLNEVFQNGPTQGRDVFIPLDWIIGGVDMAGQGWRMLMECLAAGRSISLPSTAVGGSKCAIAASTAYARIRQQFKVPISEFEGIQELIARMSAYGFMMDAARHLTMGILDSGEHPAVISAIMKAYMTEYARKIGNDAMDLHGGKGICLGPRNYLAQTYQAIPIGITVEGSNILTRNMIIFGQGAIRCHPYLMQEMDAAQNKDKDQALIEFDKALFSHLSYTVCNGLASFAYAITSGRLIDVPNTPLSRYCQHYSRMSRAFAFLADFSTMVMGSSLKRKESLSARFADILSHLYFGTAVIKYAHTLNFPKEGQVVIYWILDDLLYQIQQSFAAILDNYPNKILAKGLTLLLFPLGKRFKPPQITDGLAIARLMTQPGAFRNLVIQDAYLTDAANNPVGKLQTLFNEVNIMSLIEQYFSQAVRQGKITGDNYYDQLTQAVEKNILSTEEADELAKIYRGIKDIIAVDDFAPNELVREVKLIDDTESVEVK